MPGATADSYARIIDSVLCSRSPPSATVEEAFARVVMSAAAPAQEEVQDVLRADPAGPLDLGVVVGKYVEGLSKTPSGSCVSVSLGHFTHAMETIGVRTSDVATNTRGVALPAIAGADGRPLSPDVLLALWYSNTKAACWSRLPSKCRGAGAPGALLYADLVLDRSILTSDSGWPPGMKRGALLQLWPGQTAYESLRDDGSEPALGHSCVFLQYVEGNPQKIVVSDNSGLNHELSYPVLYVLDYVIAANLGTARLVSAR